MNFNFFLPTKLVTGTDCVVKNSTLFSSLGKHCMIVTSGSAAEKSGALNDVITALTEQQITYSIHNTVAQNPLLEDAYSAGKKAQQDQADFIIGIGGGSPLDACKAVAIYAANTMEMMDVYQYNWSNKPLPIVVVGTTAGTGSEVTQYAVMTLPDGTKRSIAHADCFPAIAFGDAKYTSSLPLSFTVSTALDALAHALEGYYNTSAGEISDLCALDAMTVLYKALGELKLATSTENIDLALREKLYYASVIAGFTLAQCGTTYCHSLGYFLTEEHHLPHGIACAVYLPGFLKRAKEKMPEKTNHLEVTIGATTEELTQLIVDLMGNIPVKPTMEEISEQVKRYDGSPNLMKVAPEGITAEEATQLMKDAFSIK